MKIKFYTFITAYLFLFVQQTGVFAQEIAKDSLTFPETWEGIWAGELDIYNAKGKAQTLPMELHILPIDSSDNHTFYIIYGEDKVAGKRPYELVTIDAEKGLYAVDEKNSIQMEAYLLGNTLIQRFEVMGNMLITINEKIDDNTITWQIISGSLEAVSTTGKEKIEGEDIPEVKGYPIGVLQKAILKKQM